MQGNSYSRGHRATLRDDGYTVALSERLKWRYSETQWHAIDVVDHSQTVGTLQREAGALREGCDLLLVAPALLAGFREAASEHDQAAYALVSACAYGIHDMSVGNGQHRAVDTIRQLSNRARARALTDPLVAGIHQVQGTGESKPLQIRHHAATQRTRRGRSADDRYTARTQKPADRHKLLLALIT